LGRNLSNLKRQDGNLEGRGENQLAKIPEDISQLNLTLPGAWLVQFKVELSEGLVARVVREKVLTAPIFQKFELARVAAKDNGDYIVILQKRGGCFIRNWRTVDMTITDLVQPLPPA
jgi:hypothetical protein